MESLRRLFDRISRPDASGNLVDRLRRFVVVAEKRQLVVALVVRVEPDPSVPGSPRSKKPCIARALSLALAPSEARNTLPSEYTPPTRSGPPRGGSGACLT